MKKFIAVAIAVLFVGVVSYRACTTIRAKKEALSRTVPEKIVPVRVVQPRLREIVEKVRASGSLQARAEVLLLPKVGGKIVRNLVQMGSPVRKGISSRSSTATRSATISSPMRSAARARASSRASCSIPAPASAPPAPSWPSSMSTRSRRSWRWTN